MRLSYLSSRCAPAYFTVIVLSLNVINVHSVYDKIFDDENLLVSTLEYDFENYDVTAIYKITNVTAAASINGGGFGSDDFGSAYENMYSLEVKQGSNAVGLPIDIGRVFRRSNDDAGARVKRDGQTFFRDTSVVKFSYDTDAWASAFAATTGDRCYPNDTDSNVISVFNEGLENFECLDIIEYPSNNVLKDQLINVLNITWKPKNQRNSLAIEYVFRENARFDMRIIISNYKDEILNSLQLKSDVNMTTLILKNKKFDQNKHYKIAFYQYSNEIEKEIKHLIRFGIFQIMSLQITENKEGMKTLLTTFRNYLKSRPTAFHVIGSLSQIRNRKRTTRVTSDCLHGGFKIKNREMCICPPGFKGKRCETGCGRNSFGADCSGKCSGFKNECRGVYLCTSGYGCTCPPGLTGNLCDQSCPPNTYGANCTRSCSSKCPQSKCNQYTGKCLSGVTLRTIANRTDSSENECETNKGNNMYLLEAPRQVSAGPNEITVEIDFEPSNVNCEEQYSNLKHYQILYKTFKDSKYTHSKSKSLSQNKVNHTIEGLNPDTTYMIGVLLINDDGKYSNAVDIAYANYNTSCIMPSGTTDYGVKIVRENKTTTVSWNPILPSPTQCKVTRYVITLTVDLDNENEQQTYTAESSAKSYATEDLLPGIEYGIQLTPWLASIALPSSPVYKYTPSLTRGDFKIENIRAKVSDSNDTIHVSWTSKCTLEDSRGALKPVPSITYYVWYKINQIFSCSLAEVENDWVKVQVDNITDHTISKVTPNAKYIIQVIIDGQEENIVYAITPAAMPSIAPVIDNNRPALVTNDTVSFAWEVDCSGLNGELTLFRVELTDNFNRHIVRSTIAKDISFDRLTPNTEYHVKVFVTNNVGYNPNSFLSYEFSTKKFGSLPISDFSIYKIDLMQVGLRWKQFDGITIDNVTISCKYNSIELNGPVTIKPKICPAWPTHFCYTWDNFILRHSSTFQIEAISSNLSKITPLSFNYKSTGNKSPDSPTFLNITANDNTSAVLTFDIPWTFNGNLTSFSISTEEISSADPKNCCSPLVVVEKPFDGEQPTYSHTLTELKHGSTYLNSLVARNSKNYSSTPITKQFNWPIPGI